MATLRVLVQIAVRNLFASRLKTFIVGGIVFFGAFLVTLGGSLLDSVTKGMARSITGTLAGDIQLYGASSKDDLALFGGFGDQNLAQVDSFETLKSIVEKVPNVAKVVPMGVSGALVTSGNTIDLVLERLRNAVRKEIHGDRTPSVLAEVDGQKAHVRQIVNVLQGEQKNLKVLLDARKVTQEDRDAAAALDTAASAGFWEGFDRDPLNALEFLENKIAPQSTDADMLYLRYVGTDMSVFRRSFDRFRIVDGTVVPEGKRGFLFANFFYEDRVKLHTARRLDKLHEALTVKRQSIGTDPDLQRLVKENQAQTREILLQLDPGSTREMTTRLQGELGSREGDLAKLLASFFAMDDANFEGRYRFFYDRLAPLIELYRIRVGDTITIKAFTKTGYSRSVNLRVYGTFEFQGLEKSPLAGAVNLMDLVSFRELYGFLTPDNQQEVRQIELAAGEKAIDRAH
ncbi:MAG: ABC transporter permease, partial [Deltaproteobacteria bacterium]